MRKLKPYEGLIAEEFKKSQIFQAMHVAFLADRGRLFGLCRPMNLPDASIKCLANRRLIRFRAKIRLPIV